LLVALVVVMGEIHVAVGVAVLVVLELPQDLLFQQRDIQLLSALVVRLGL
tara:strand:- start:538 stop:687 length:150 start_codon:yes stop_codon:yes gene_type:complete